MRQHRLFCALLLLLLPPVMLAGAWRLGGISALEDDLIYYFPIRAFIGDAIRSGEWPLWNPYVGMGTSIAADPQAGLWYPVTWLFAVLPALWAYPATICMHFSLAAWGMYRFLRALGREWRVALLGAVAFEFCGFLVGQRAHLTILEATAWLPWMLYGWTRYAVTRRRGYYAVAVAALGFQMLVQHLQITIISLAIVGVYAAVELRPLNRTWWRWLAIGTINGILIGSVQLLPTLAMFARSTRSALPYDVFVENSYAPTSVFMWLFPMLFGSRTPNFYDQRWWGWSHFCEQATYASIAILVLMIASLGLWRRDRSVRFWWLLAGGCFLLALGEFTPLYRILFYVPVIRSLRVPARWMLGLDIAMIVLATASLDAWLRQNDLRPLIRRWIVLAVSRVLPAITLIMLGCMVVARFLAPRIEGVAKLKTGTLAAALQPLNPVIWIPILLMLLTAWALLRLLNESKPGRVWTVFALMLVDLASVAAFVDVDMRQYANVDEILNPPLAKELAGRTGATGERLWVPRFDADYDRPAEVLWPQTNLNHRISVFHGYGPIWSTESRLLLQFMPWGSSHDVLGMLYNPRLLAAMGVRWLAASSEEERELMRLAAVPPDLSRMAPLTPAGQKKEYRNFAGFELPVVVDQPGVYAVEFKGWPTTGNRNRWFIWIEDESGKRISDQRMFDPSDFSLGPQTVRCFLRCSKPSANAKLRGWVEKLAAATISDLQFGRVAPWTQEDRTDGPYRLVKELPDGVRLYELASFRPRVAWAEKLTQVNGILGAEQKLKLAPELVGLPGGVVIDGPESMAGTDSGPIRILEQSLNRLAFEVSGELKEGTPRTVIINDTYDPGWRATVRCDRGDANREELSINHANGIVSAVSIPSAGNRIIELKYWPEALTQGILATAFGLAMVVISCLLIRLPAVK